MSCSCKQRNKGDTFCQFLFVSVLFVNMNMFMKWVISANCFFPCAWRVPLLYLQTVVGDVVRTLKVMYGSLDRRVRLSWNANTVSPSQSTSFKTRFNPLLFVIVTLSFTVSPHSAFCNADHAPRLDHFFCLFFQQIIQPSRLRDGSSAQHPDVSGALFLDGLPAVRWLTLPPEIKVQ